MPSNLDLYRYAVQHPIAEVALLDRMATFHGGALPMTLREDFCGTAAVASTFIASDPQRQAIGVDHDAATIEWARTRHAAEQPDRADVLHLIESDVLAFRGPKVDAIAVLNYSIFEWHTPVALRRYLKHAWKRLQRDGLVVMDLFGGPDAMRPMSMTRRVEPDALDMAAYDCIWEQRRYDAATSRIDCRLHFELTVDGRTERRESAFRYDWRLWSPAELMEAARDVGFGTVELWAKGASGASGADSAAGLDADSDSAAGLDANHQNPGPNDPNSAPSAHDSLENTVDGQMAPITELVDREAYTACVVARK